MDMWKFENNPGKQTALSLAYMVVGIILVIASRHFNGQDTTNSLAGFLLVVYSFPSSRSGMRSWEPVLSFVKGLQRPETWQAGDWHIGSPTWRLGTSATTFRDAS
jgi:hypothetical protein